MNDIFDRNDTEFAKLLLDDRVVRDWNSLSVDLEVSSLVHELSHRFEVWFTVCNIWLDKSQHLRSGLGKLDKDTVVDLEQSKKLHDLSWLWWNLVDTLDSDHECKFGLCWNVEVTILLCGSLETDLLSLGLTVLLNVLLCSLEDDFSFLLGSLCHCQRSFRTKLVEEVSRFRPERWYTYSCVVCMIDYDCTL